MKIEVNRGYVTVVTSHEIYDVGHGNVFRHPHGCADRSSRVGSVTSGTLAALVFVGLDMAYRRYGHSKSW